MELVHLNELQFLFKPIIQQNFQSCKFKNIAVIS